MSSQDETILSILLQDGARMGAPDRAALATLAAQDDKGTLSRTLEQIGKSGRPVFVLQDGKVVGASGDGAKAPHDSAQTARLSALANFALLGDELVRPLPALLAYQEENGVPVWSHAEKRWYRLYKLDETTSLVLGGVPSDAAFFSEDKENLFTLMKEGALALSELATLDGLTKIPNRRNIEQVGPERMAAARRASVDYENMLKVGHKPLGGPPFLTAMMLDIDFFKKVNDTHGHPVGDEVLKAVAQSLKECLTRPGDFVGRYGGEEFLALFHGNKPEGVEHVAEKILESIRKLEFVGKDGKKFQITASLGVACSNGDEPFDMLVAKADKALYEAKETGRNRAVYSGERSAFVPTSPGVETRLEA